MTQENTDKLVEIYTGKLAEFNKINEIYYTTRLKAISSTHAFVAINNNLYEIHIGYPSKYKIEKGRQGPFVSRPIELENIKILNQNKPILSSKHPIQSINVCKNNDENYVISCIDNKGVLYVKILDESKQDKEIGNPPPLKKRKLNECNNSNYNTCIAMQHGNGLNALFSIANGRNGRNALCNLRMSGYCSHDINKTSDKFAAISSYYNSLNIGCIGNKNQIIANIYLPQTPTTVKYYNIPKSGNNSCVILINEGNILSVWDERELRKCIKRIDLRHPMYSIDINAKSSSKYIACCGESKIVHIIDPFKWNVHSMWKSQSKYQLLQCKFSKFDRYGKYIYCVGMDHDLLTGQWETSGFIPNKRKQAKHTKLKHTATNALRFQHCFRADSKWIGVDYVNDRNFESMIGITNTATIYVAHKPHKLDASQY